MKGKITKSRTCYRCKYPLYKSDYFSRNDHIPKDELKKIWINKDIELICCECYEKCKNNPKLLNDRLIEISGQERFELSQVSTLLQKTKSKKNLELIDIYAHNATDNLFFIDYYHDVNIRYRYIISREKSVLINYMSSHKPNNKSKMQNKEISNLSVDGIRYFYRLLEKYIEL